MKAKQALIARPTRSVGRPSVMDQITLGKLEHAFSLGCTDKEACLFANIAPDTLYYYQSKNPDFCQRKALLKEKPLMKARSTVVESLDDPNHAEWYLERKSYGEFSSRQSVELSGKDGKAIEVSIVRYDGK